MYVSIYKPMTLFVRNEKKNTCTSLTLMDCFNKTF